MRDVLSFHEKAQLPQQLKLEADQLFQGTEKGRKYKKGGTF